MPGDRDRLSYDERQQYRSVVAQQGRVTVPADFNEAQEIFAEEQRKEALWTSSVPAALPTMAIRSAFPVRTRISICLVGAGHNVRGRHASLAAQPVRYFAQPDWIDPPAAQSRAAKNEYVYLYLQEQEIGAVEDQSLKDRALGGPDSTQRTRLLQHIVRASTQGQNCPEALQNRSRSGQRRGWASIPPRCG